jgi:hypothetical protein
VTVRIKNWAQFQHFKDRRPPWVKLYRELLDDIEWHELDPKHAKTLVMLWLIASETDGELPSTKKLSFRLRLTEKAVSESLEALSHWLEQNDISQSSLCAQGDIAAISGGYVETETEKRQRESAREAFELPSWVPEAAWAGYVEMRRKIRKPLTDRAKTLLVGELAKLREQGHDPQAVLDTATTKGWLSVYAPRGDGRTVSGVAL